MDGTATLTVSGGTTGYSYFWKGPGTFTATTKDLTGLKKGMYLVFVTDANGCSDLDIVFIDEPTGMTLSSTAYMYTGGNNISCNGESDGSIDLTVAGGTPSYTYNWNNGATSQDLSGLAAGTYSVTVTDGNGCTKVHTRTLTQPAPLSATQSLSNYNGQNISCFGESDGTIKLYPAGGSGPYIYAWNTGSNADTLWNLPAGVYTVTLTDLNSCQIVHNVTLTQPDLLIAVGTPKTYNGGWNIACYGESNGEIAMAPTGGTTPYSYTWSNGQTGATATGLPVGAYSVTVVDVNGCTDYNSWTLTEPDTLIANGTPKTYNGGWNISCYGESDGEIDLTVTGGTTAYAYNWSNGATTQDVSGLPAGPYSVTVTDANMCMDTYYVTLTQPDSLIANGTPKTYNGGWNISCNGESDGEIDLAVTGGTTAYVYNWSNGATTQDVSGLPAGPYSVTVTDANMCMDTYYVTLTEPDPLVASGTAKTYNGGWNISCNGESDGEIDLTVTGGTTAYVYNWSNGATTQDVSGLPAGPYTVTVTDANNCMDTYYISLTEPDLLVANVAQTDTGCVGADANEITITAAGGTAAYLYSIDGGNSTSTANVFTGLAPGAYNIYVSDANGCTATNTITLVDYAKPIANAGPDSTWYVGYAPAECLRLNGTASNGTAGYSYSWSNGATTDTTTVCYSGSASETFTLIVTDVNGCKDTDQVTIDTMDVRCSQPAGFNYVRICARVAGSSNFQTVCVAQNTVPYYFRSLDASWGPCPIPKEVESYSVMDAYKVYPNPSNGIFNIEAYNEFENDRVIVYDAVGKLIIDKELNGKVEQVDMSIYNTGVYYMQVSVGGFVKTTKVILH
jgi:hypothetical protein